MQQELVVPIRLGVSRQDEMTPVGSGQVNIHHPDGGELFQYFPRSQAGGMGSGKILQGDLEAVGHERQEDMGLDPLLLLLEHRPDGKVMLHI